MKAELRGPRDRASLSFVQKLRRRAIPSGSNLESKPKARPGFLGARASSALRDRIANDERPRDHAGHADAAEIEAWLESLALDQLYEPATWQELNVLCWVAAGDENILPACGRYDPTAQYDSITR